LPEGVCVQQQCRCGCSAPACAYRCAASDATPRARAGFSVEAGGEPWRKAVTPAAASAAAHPPPLASSGLPVRLVAHAAEPASGQAPRRTHPAARPIRVHRWGGPRAPRIRTRMHTYAHAYVRGHARNLPIPTQRPPRLPLTRTPLTCSALLRPVRRRRSPPRLLAAVARRRPMAPPCTALPAPAPTPAAAAAATCTPTAAEAGAEAGALL
jgi:hypothetical protein